MKALRALFLPAIVSLLVACQSLGLAPAQSFDTKLAYAYGTHTAVLEAANAAVAAGSLTHPEGAQVLSLADQSRTLLDSARELETSNTATAGNKLALAAAILAQLQTYLHTRGIK